MRQGARRSGVLMVSVNALSILCSFIRNIAIARMVGPAEFGLAVILVLVASAADILSDLGWDRYLILRKMQEPTDEEALATVHRLKLISGAGMAALIAVFAPFVAASIGQPQAWLPISLVALICLVRAAVHSDYRLKQRDMDFRGEARVELARCLADLVVGVVAAYLLRSYWAMLIALTAGAGAGVLASYFVAERRYRIAWNSIYGRASLAFGLPLLLNNLIVFISGQGDRFLVGAGLSMKDLGVYAAGITIISGGQALINRTVIGVGLPYLSRFTGDQGSYNRAFQTMGIMVGAAATSILVGASMVGAELVTLLFGGVYKPPTLLLVGIGIAQGLNTLRIWPTVGLLAHGETKTIPLANGVRLIGLIIAASALGQGYGVIAVGFCLAIGEMAGVISALLWHSRRLGYGLASVMIPIMAMIVVSGVDVAVVALLSPPLGWRIGIAALLLAALTCVILYVFQRSFMRSLPKE